MMSAIGIFRQADSIPSYVIRNDARTKFCCYEQLIGSQLLQTWRRQAIKECRAVALHREHFRLRLLRCTERASC
jgi:hypothetical protein